MGPRPAVVKNVSLQKIDPTVMDPAKDPGLHDRVPSTLNGREQHPAASKRGKVTQNRQQASSRRISKGDGSLPTIPSKPRPAASASQRSETRTSLPQLPTAKGPR